MEAMGRGLVVVAAPTGGIVEMIVDGHSGFLTANDREFESARGGASSMIVLTLWQRGIHCDLMEVGD
jgi:hypothetical protein